MLRLISGFNDPFSNNYDIEAIIGFNSGLQSEYMNLIGPSHT